MARTGTFFGPEGVRLVINTSDPDTPSMVYLKQCSATFDCALGEGGVEYEGLSPRQYAWLETFQNDSDAAYDVARRDLPQYQ